MWTSIIKPKVFTNVQKKGKEKLLKKFPNINFTTSDKSTAKPKFPTVYIKQMQGSAKGKDLEASAINATLSIFQIEVTTNTTQNDADIVADIIENIMVSMLYEPIGEPFADSNSDVYRNIARYQRIIGYNDILNF